MYDDGLIDSPARSPQIADVKRLATMLLFLGVMVGLAGQPVRAMAPAMAGMTMTKMTQADISAMPDCMASMAKDTSQKPCKCGMSGCIAMMAAGASFMLADGVVAPAAVIAKERQDHVLRVATLRGRMTAPEPEPPTILV